MDLENRSARLSTDKRERAAASNHLNALETKCWPSHQKLLGGESFQFGRMAVHAGLFIASSVEVYSSLCGHRTRSFWIGVFNLGGVQVSDFWGVVGTNELLQPLSYFVKALISTFALSFTLACVSTVWNTNRFGSPLVLSFGS